MQLDADGDENRIVKFADIQLFVEIDEDPVRYRAIHTPTGITSDHTKRHSSFKQDWAVSDCVHKVIMSQAKI